MIVYNITYCVDRVQLPKWNVFVEDHLKPFFEENKNIVGFRYFKVLTVEEGASPTFSFQLEMSNINDVRLFKEEEPALKSLVYINFQDSCLSFETVLKKVD